MTKALDAQGGITQYASCREWLEANLGSRAVLKALLVCGIVSSLLYVGSDLVASMRYSGYSYAHMSFSELLAIGSPVRSFMIPLSAAYNVLVLAFALGVWRVSAGKRSLRITAVLVFAYGIASLVGPYVPMHARGAGVTLTDVLHIACTVVIVLASLLAMGFAAAALGARFRLFSIGTLLTVLVFGVVAGARGDRIAAGLATPWLGVIERANVYSIMLWMLGLGVALLYVERE